MATFTGGLTAGSAHRSAWPAKCWKVAGRTRHPHSHDDDNIDIDFLFEQMDVDFNDVSDC